MRAIVVGASRGLGLELVRAVLGRRGAAVAIVHADSSELGGLQRRYADQLIVRSADVRSESELRAASESLGDGPPYEALIYNAAIHLERDRRDIEGASAAELLDTLDVNAVGAVRALKHFRRWLSPGGLVVLISSEAGSIANTRRSSEYGYCMSKAALNMLGQLLANREQSLQSGVQVVSIHPGWMRTQMGGPNADISATEAAEDILRTLETWRVAGGPPFIDRSGKPLAW